MLAEGCGTVDEEAGEETVHLAGYLPAARANRAVK